MGATQFRSHGDCSHDHTHRGKMHSDVDPHDFTDTLETLSHQQNLKLIATESSDRSGDEEEDIPKPEKRDITTISIPVETPIGSGCIAQVYRGEMLLPPSTHHSPPHAAPPVVVPVAVKVLHPRARQQIEADFLLIQTAIDFIEYIFPKTLAFLNASEAIRNFGDTLLSQTDLRVEADRTERFRENFKNYDNIFFPEIFFSSEQVLVESFEHGRCLSELLEARRAARDRETGTPVTGDGGGDGGTMMDGGEKGAGVPGGGAPHSAASGTSSSDEELDGELDATPRLMMRKRLSTGNWLQEMIKKKSGEERNPKSMLPQTSPDVSPDAASPPSEASTAASTPAPLTPRRLSRGDDEKLRLGICELALQSYLKMLFEDAFIHGDLHPGNVFFRGGSTTSRAGGSSGSTTTATPPSGRSGVPSPPQLIYLDCGLTVQLNKKDADNFADCIYVILNGTPEDAGRLLIKRAPPEKRSMVVDSEEFVKKVGKLIENFRASRGDGLNVATVTANLLLYAGEHSVPLETNFVQVAISLAVVDGIGRQLRDDFNIFKSAGPYLAKAAVRYAAGF